MPKHFWRQFSPYFYLIVDLILIQWSLDLAVLLRQQIGLGGSFTSLWFFFPNLSLRLVVGLAWVFLSSLFAVYSYKRRSSGLWAELKALGQTLLTSLGILAIAIFLLDYDEFSRLTYLYFAIVSIVLLTLAHAGMRVLRAASGDTQYPRRVLIAGTGSLARATATAIIERSSPQQLCIVGFLSDESGEIEKVLERPILGTLDDATKLVTQYEIQEVVVALSAPARGKVARLFRLLQDLPVRTRLVPDTLDRVLVHSSLEELTGVELLNLYEPRLQAFERFAKRSLDLVGAVIGFTIFSPIMFLIAILIKLDSPGPVLFSQTRIGKNGKPFTFYKFRSMDQNTNERVHQEYIQRLIRGEAEAHIDQVSGEAVLKMVNDKRITRFGSFLRKSSLDELPQLINVIRGEMSLVGPRPPIPYEVAEYEEWHKRRLEAIPGITGLWQVQGRSQVSFDEMIRMDIEYIEHQSLWLDLKILLKTPHAVIMGKGAG